MPYILIIISVIALAVLALRYAMLRREIARLAAAMDENHTQKTMRQLTIASQQPQLRRLAVCVNTLYSDMDAEAAAGRAAMDEIRQSMANISHDLRTPLTSIIGYLKLLQGGDNTREQQEQYLQTAYQKTRELHTLVNGLFELARLENGGYTFQNDRLDAAEVLAQELADSYPRLEEAGKLPEIDLSEGELWIVGDRDALRRVFSNLLQNMQKHGHAPMRIESAAVKGVAEFRFSNAAPDLSAQDVPQLFRRFFTADRMRSGNDTGLGLAIVQEFVRQMNGEAAAALEDNTLTIILKFPMTV